MFAGCPLDVWEGNKYTQRGHELEDEAALAYELLTGRETATIGFVTDDDQNYGCSPDRAVGEDGLLEIKCLPKKHISMLLYIEKHGRIPPDYVPQTQGQLFVTGRKWVDLMFYHPILPDQIVRVTPVEALQEAISEQLCVCLAERGRVLNILEGL